MEGNHQIHGESGNRYHVVDIDERATPETPFRLLLQRVASKDSRLLLGKVNKYPTLYLNEKDALLAAREFQNGSRLRGFVRVYDWNDRERLLIMEYLIGGDLKQVVKRGVLDPEIAVGITAYATRNLLTYREVAKRNHGDVKPANIVLDGEAKSSIVEGAGIDEIVRPGFGKWIDLSFSRNGRQGKHGLGTPAYIPPERITGKPNGKGDVYSLGMMLYELIEGVQRVPIAAADLSDDELLEAHAHPSDYRRSQELAPLLRHMVDRDPRNRWNLRKTYQETAKWLKHRGFDLEQRLDPSRRTTSA